MNNHVARPLLCRVHGARVARLPGAWLAILALVVQIVISSLPTPGYAAGVSFSGDVGHICSTHHAKTAASKDQPQAPHRHTHCAFCVAVNFGPNLLPPLAGNIIGNVAGTVVPLPSPQATGAPTGTRYSPQQPRGPPAIL